MELRDTLLFSSQEQRFWLKAFASENIPVYVMNEAAKQMRKEEKEINCT
jgi:hypothetical protein